MAGPGPRDPRFAPAGQGGVPGGDILPLPGLPGFIYSWEAGKLDDFQVLLEEAAASDQAEASALAQAAASALSGKPRHRSTDAAMLLSIIPGAGLAYAGDWSSAGKTFLAGSFEPR